MDAKSVLEHALKPRPEERIFISEELLRSLDEPDADLDAIWADEAERRLQAYREGRMRGIEHFPRFQNPADAGPFAPDDIQND